MSHPNGSVIFMSNVTQIGELVSWGGEKGKQFIEKEVGRDSELDRERPFPWNA